MIGELFNSMVNEVIGDDPENRRIAGLPYKAAKMDAGLDLLAFDLNIL